MFLTLWPFMALQPNFGITMCPYAIFKIKSNQNMYLHLMVTFTPWWWEEKKTKQLKRPIIQKYLKTWNVWWWGSFTTKIIWFCSKSHRATYTVPLIVLPVNIILAMVYWLLGPHNTVYPYYTCIEPIFLILSINFLMGPTLCSIIKKVMGID